MMRAMLDTNIVSALMRGPGDKVRRRLDELGVHNVCMSIITAGELEFGLARTRSPKVSAWVADIMDTIQVADMEASVARPYGELRAYLAARGRIIGPNDIWIAAHALALDLTLVTANIREFSRVPGLSVENWLD